MIEGSLLNLSCFKVWSAAHVNRKGNVAAHMMARMAKSVEDYKIWVEDTPPILVDQVLKDVSNLYQVSV